MYYTTRNVDMLIRNAEAIAFSSYCGALRTLGQTAVALLFSLERMTLKMVRRWRS